MVSYESLKSIVCTCLVIVGEYIFRKRLRMLLYAAHGVDRSSFILVLRIQVPCIIYAGSTAIIIFIISIIIFFSAFPKLEKFVNNKKIYNLKKKKNNLTRLNASFAIVERDRR